MTTEEALLAAIWASPHDDLPRLVYADWLDETGDPVKVARAEFIRVQCELAKSDLTADQQGRLERKERDLWLRHRRDFKRGLPPRLSDKPFHRGFVAPPLFYTSTQQFVTVYRLLLPAAPLWRIALGSGVMADVVAVIDDPLFLRFSELRASSNGGAFRALAPGRRYNLTDLLWSYSFARPEGVQQLVACDFPYLHTLGLDGGDIGDEGAEMLASSKLAGQLRRLNLSSNKIGPQGVTSMSGQFPRLADLDLSYSKRGDELVAELVRGTAWPSLRRLRLFGSELTTRTAELLAEWPGAASLEHLDLSGNVEVGAAGARLLTRSEHLVGLKSLHLFPSNRDREEVVGLLTARFGTARATDRQGFFILGGERE